jgi:hypothetical protein
MGLSDDQRAMLRLLAQREQGYEDIAALMGLSVDEVRAKVKDALSQLEEEGAAAPPLPPEPEPEPEPAPKPVEPVAVTPAPAQAAAKPAPPASTPAPKRTSSSRPKLSLPSESGPRATLAAGVAVVILLIVVILVSGGGDSGSDTTTATSTDTANEAEADGSTQVNSKEVTQAVLSAADGSDASGVATFGRIKNSLALQVEAEGLAPTEQGQSYTIWLAQSPQKMLPLASTAVPASGKIGAQVEVPTEVLAYLAKGTFDQMTITLTTDATLKASLAKATSEKKSPVYTGTAVLGGPITGPIVGAADKAEE